MTGPVDEPGRRLPLGALAVVAALVAVTAVGTVTSSPRTARATPTQVEVVGATVVCPDMREKPGVLVSRASVGATPLPPDRAPGPITGSVLEHAGANPRVSTPLGVAAPGQVSVGVGTRIDQDALVVSASGVLAAGLQAEQVTRGESGRDRGLAGMRCESPKTEAWFEGGSEKVGDETILVLANVDDTPAIVDVTTFSSTGPVDPRPGQGISIAPHSRQVLNVDRLAPDRGLLALHVTTRFGRVAAALRYSRLHGSDPDGVEWVPQTLPPAQRVVVPGVPQVVEQGQRFLSLTNPTSDDTSVSVQVTSKDEQFVPTSLADVSIPAGTTVVRPLTDLTKDGPITLTVTSDGAPVLAGAYVQDRQQGSPLAEFGFTSSSLPLSGPALLTDLVINRPTESTLILSAPGAAASVMVTPLQVLGTQGPLPKPKLVQVPAGRTVDLRLSTFFKPGADTKLAVEVRPLPGSGDVYAARYLRERGAHGPLVTLLDLKGPALRVQRPAVIEDGLTFD